MNKIGLNRIEGLAIWMHNIMEPYVRNGISCFWAPRVISLSASKYETPINSPHTFILKKGKMCHKLWITRSRHIFGADDWSIVFLIRSNLLRRRSISDLVHETSQYAWNVITSLSLRINSLIKSKEASPFHLPEVKGWVGFAERAHSKALVTNGRLLTKYPEFPTSLYRSHITTASDVLKAPTIWTTYFCKSLYSIWTLPGHWSHCELWIPGRGSGCLPFCQVSRQQSSNRTNIIWAPLLFATARNVKISLIYWVEFFRKGPMCKKTLNLEKPMLVAQRNSWSIASKFKFYHISI